MASFFQKKLSRDSNHSQSKKASADLEVVAFLSVFFLPPTSPSAPSSSQPPLKATSVRPIKAQPLTFPRRIVTAPVFSDHGAPPDQTLLLSCAFPVGGGLASVHFRNLGLIVSDNINSMDMNLDELVSALKYMEACLYTFCGSLEPFIRRYYGDPIAIDDFHRLIDRVRDDVIGITKSATGVAMARDVGGMCMSFYDLECSIQMLLSEALNKIKEGEKVVNRFLVPFGLGSNECYYNFLDHLDDLAQVIERETPKLNLHFLPTANNS